MRLHGQDSSPVRWPVDRVASRLQHTEFAGPSVHGGLLSLRLFKRRTRCVDRLALGVGRRWLAPDTHLCRGGGQIVAADRLTHDFTGEIRVDGGQQIVEGQSVPMFQTWGRQAWPVDAQSVALHLAPCSVEID